MMTYRATTPVCVLVTLIGRVVCITSGSANVRLVNGESPYYGQLEVYDKTNGEWLPVSYGGYVNRRAFTTGDIVCEELGFPGAMWTGGEPDGLRGDTRRRIKNIVCENKLSLVDCDYVIGEKPEDTTAAIVRCFYDGYLGRYNYHDLSKLVPNLTSDQLTIQACLEYCRNQRETYRYIGLRSGDLCYCISDLSNFERKGFGISMQCSGDNAQMCGSWDRYDIYSISIGACGGHVYLNETTTIYSPGFPGSYSPNESCSWTLETSTDGVLGTEFTFLNIGRNDELEVSFFDGGWHYVDILKAPAYFCSSKLQLSFLSQRRNNFEKGSFIVKFRESVPDCQPPLNLTDHSMTFERFCPYFQGDILSISCKEGYMLDSVHRSIECLENGKWNDTIPECAVIDCGNPGNVDDAEIDEVDISFTYNSSVRYACHEGYHIEGSDVITCTDSGNWTSKPFCVENHLHTSKLSQPGSVFGIGTIVGSTITAIIGITAVIFLAVCICRRKSSNSQHNVVQGDYEVTETHPHETRDRSIDPVSSQQQDNFEDTCQGISGHSHKPEHSYQSSIVENIAYDSAGKAEDDV
ncbi:uncharacterized protein [Ptychodera flava]|uniref:uncharacterized protein n=1 Tax=Ptychodera flava TaxID=63121 RepID=UPI00396A25AC